MQPKIIENFISKDTCNYLNNYFLNSIDLDDQGYANIYIKEGLPYYNEQYLFKTLNKYDKDESLFIDMLNLISTSIKAELSFSKEDVDVQLFNYRNFGSGQDFKDYHIDDDGDPPAAMFTALLYLTDDYEGGEITFYDGVYPNPDGPITYKPKAGSLFLFRAFDAHKINPVLTGKRALFSINIRNPKNPAPWQLKA